MGVRGDVLNGFWKGEVRDGRGERRRSLMVLRRSLVDLVAILGDW